MTTSTHQPIQPSLAALLTALRAIDAPANVEEWLIRADHDAVNAESLEPQTAAYRQGVYDVLAALGALGSDGKAVSPNAYYFVQSLIYAIQENSLTAGSWQGRPDESCTGFGARIIRTLESARLECVPAPSPLRIVRVATAVIKSRHNGQDVYLMQFDEKARQFQPIGGKQEDFDLSNEAALTRELCEELQIPALTLGQDFQVKPLALDVQVNEVSASIHVITRYSHNFYHLKEVRFPLPIDEITRWLTYDELMAGQTSDGYTVSTLFNQFIPGVLSTLDYSV